MTAEQTRMSHVLNAVRVYRADHLPGTHEEIDALNEFVASATSFVHEPVEKETAQEWELEQEQKQAMDNTGTPLPVTSTGRVSVPVPVVRAPVRGTQFTDTEL